MKQKDLFVGISFFTFAIGLGLLVAQAPPTDATQLAQMEPAAGEESVQSDLPVAETPASETEEEMDLPVAEPMNMEESSPEDSLMDTADTETEEKAIPLEETNIDFFDIGEDMNEGVESSGEESMNASDVMPSQEPRYIEPASDVDSSDYNLQEAIALRTIGSPNAPLTVYEYSSLSCHHCADFHEKTFPLIKKNLIDTGKIQWVFVPFPNNEPALVGAMISQCVHPRRFERILDLLYQNQKRWAFSKNPVDNLYDLVRIAGIDRNFFTKCIQDNMLENALISQMQKHAYKHHIGGTPTFVYEPGDYKINGAISYSMFHDKYKTVVRLNEETASEE